MKYAQLLCHALPMVWNLDDCPWLLESSSQFIKELKSSLFQHMSSFMAPRLQWNYSAEQVIMAILFMSSMCVQEISEAYLFSGRWAILVVLRDFSFKIKCLPPRTTTHISVDMLAGNHQHIGVHCCKKCSNFRSMFWLSRSDLCSGFRDFSSAARLTYPKTIHSLLPRFTKWFCETALTSQRRLPHSAAWKAIRLCWWNQTMSRVASVAHFMHVCAYSLLLNHKHLIYWADITAMTTSLCHQVRWRA